MPQSNHPLRENLLVSVMSISAGLVFLDRYGLAYAFPRIHEELGLNNAQLGMLMSVTAIAWAVSSIVCSWVSDRLGGKARGFVVLAMVLFSLATGLTSLVTSFSGLIIVRILLGALEGPVIPLMTATVVAASSPHRRGANLGIVIAGISLLGFALPPLLLTLLIERFGWRHAFFLIAIPGLVLAGLLAVVMRGVVVTAANQERVDFSIPAVVKVMARRNVILAILGGGALIGLGTTFASFAPSFLIASGSMTPNAAGLLLTIYGLLGAAGTVIGPALSDRLGRKPVLLVGAVLSVILPASVALFRDHYALLMCFMPLQLIAGGTLTLFVYVIPGEAVPKTLTATTFAVILAIGELVDGSIGPWIAGVLSDGYGLAASMWTCVALATLALIAAVPLKTGSPATDMNSEPLPLHLKPVGNSASAPL